MDDKKIKIFKKQKQIEQLFTEPNCSTKQRSMQTSPSQREEKKECQKLPQQAQDIFGLNKEEPKIILETKKMNKMHHQYPQFKRIQINKQNDVKDTKSLFNYENHQNQIRVDSSDDTKHVIWSKEENIKEQFNYLYADIPPPQNKLQGHINNKNISSPSTSCSHRRGTPNLTSTKSASRSPENTFRLTKSGVKKMNFSFYRNDETDILNTCKQRSDLIKQNIFSLSKKYNNFLNNSLNLNQRSNSAFNTSNERQVDKESITDYYRSVRTPESSNKKNFKSFLKNSINSDDSCSEENLMLKSVRISNNEGQYFKKTNNNLAKISKNMFKSQKQKSQKSINANNNPVNESISIKNLNTSQSKRSDTRSENKNVKFDGLNQPQNLFRRTNTITEISSPINNQLDNQQKVNKFITEPDENMRYSSINNININKEEYTMNESQRIKYVNNIMNNSISGLSNFKKQEIQDNVEWKYIEFVHRRRSLSVQPDCQKVNKIIKWQQQQNQTPKNCSLNSQIQKQQLQRYFDQYLITSKPSTPTQIKDIRQKLSVTKQILREQGLEENDNLLKKRISKIIQTQQPSFMITEYSDDPAFFLKNRLSQITINYDKNNFEDYYDQTIPESVEDETQNYNSKPQITKTPEQLIKRLSTDFSRQHKLISRLSKDLHHEFNLIAKLEDFEKQDRNQKNNINEEEESSEGSDSQINKTFEKEENDENQQEFNLELMLSKDSLDNEFDEDRLKQKQKKLEMMQLQRSQRNKDPKFWEKSTKKQLLNPDEQDQPSYLRQTKSSMKQKRIKNYMKEQQNNSEERNMFQQIGTILNDCQKFNKQNKIDYKLFERVHQKVNKKNQMFAKIIPRNEDEEENFEQDFKEIIKEEKIHDFYKQQLLCDYKDSIKLIQESRTQTQQTNDLSRPKKLIKYVENNILNSLITNPALYSHLLVNIRKKKLKEDKAKIRTYVNQQEKDMSKLVKYSDFISIK